MKYKNQFEQIVLESFPCIVTTIASAFTQQVTRRRFKRIVIDEATMVKEHEAFLSTLHAEQIVLIGDQKQLGPTFNFKIEGPSSLFTRLIEAGHPYKFLDTQYRMHDTLMRVPNLLFYDNKIKSGYKEDDQKIFLYSKVPFLFVNVMDGEELSKGTSFCNMKEVQATVDMVEFCCQQLNEVKEFNEVIEQIKT